MSKARREISGSWYRAYFDRDAHLLKIHHKRENLYYYLSLFSEANPPGRVDENLEISAPRKRATRRSGVQIYVVETRSRAWKRKQTVYEFHRERIEIYHVLHGTGKLDRLFFFRGRYRDTEYGSVPGFDTVRTGQVNFLNAERFHISQPLSISPANDTRYWGHALSAGPLMYTFSNGLEPSCLGMCCVAEPGEYGFRGFDFNYATEQVQAAPDAVVGTQSFSLSYDGQLRVRDTFTTPRLVLWYGKDEQQIGARHNALLKKNGTLKRRRRQGAQWWRQPIFCGWHEQVYLGLQQRMSGNFESGEAYGDACTQENYEGFCARLEEHGLDPGTLIIDAYWQQRGAFMSVDTAKWPDLAGFVRRRQERNQHVLLWCAAWTPEGLPARECIRDADGKPVAPDPTHPAFQRRMQAACQRMFGKGEGCYGADGLKIDATNNTPGGPGFRNRGNVWGFELLRAYLALVYESAKAVRGDVLISTFCAHPYFNDVSDMVRLGDLYTAAGDAVSTARRRREICRMAMPDNLVDTDSLMRWCVADDYRSSFAEQVRLGIPCTYTSGPLYRARGFHKVIFSDLSEEDYRAMRQAWAQYRKAEGLSAPGGR